MAEHCLGRFAYCQNLCRLFAGRESGDIKWALGWWFENS